MSDYVTGLLHGIGLSVITDIISNFITILIAKHLFDKSKLEKVSDAIKHIFKRK